MEKIKITDITKLIIAKETSYIVYNYIDKEQYIKRLLEHKFSSDIFENEYSRLETAKSKEFLERQRFLRLLWGYKPNLNLWRHMRETDTEMHEKNRYKEWCEQYNDYYGNTHPIYGGTLTDLFNLPVGYSFYVTNGCYDATIVTDEHGDKCVLTCWNCFKLTKERHSLYIN